MEINNCTRCGKELNDFKVNIKLEMRVDRKKDSSVWEYIPNLDTRSHEILCVECFDKFSNLMSELNIKYEK